MREDTVTRRKNLTEILKFKPTDPAVSKWDISDKDYLVNQFNSFYIDNSDDDCNRYCVGLHFGFIPEEDLFIDEIYMTRAGYQNMLEDASEAHIGYKLRNGDYVYEYSSSNGAGDYYIKKYSNYNDMINELIASTPIWDDEDED